MSEQHIQDDRLGSSNHPQHRAPEGEGVDAPFRQDKGPIQSSVFDGAGNEVVVVTTEDEEGRRSQGTGASAAEAAAEARDPSERIGDAFGPAADH